MQIQFKAVFKFGLVDWREIWFSQPNLIAISGGSSSKIANALQLNSNDITTNQKPKLLGLGKQKNNEMVGIISARKLMKLFFCCWYVK